MHKIILSLLIFISSQTLLKSQVIQNWAQLYGKGTDGVYNVTRPVIDNFGNVFVAGSVDGQSLTDYVTVKYNSSGAEQWSSIFTGLIEDRVIDIVLDTEGNVIVTGLSENQTGTYDIITIKYNNADGDSLWVKRYNGENAFTMDQPVAMDIDHDNNVYVTGYSFGSAPMATVTIKYNSDGDSLWTSKFISGDLPVDNYADDAGNVYVCGRGTRIIKYDTNGNELWNRQYDFESTDHNKILTGDSQGNVYFAAKKHTATFDDFAVVKLNSNGDMIWSEVRNGFGGTQTTHDDPRAICVDNAGNVFLTGEIYMVTLAAHITTIKYNSSGIFQWERDHYDSQSGDGGNDIVCDNSGNVYVTGGNNDYTTIKYNTNGDSLWVIRYNGPGNGMDIGSAIAIDNAGQLYVNGRSRITSSSQNFEMATVKYSQTATGIISIEMLDKEYKLHQNYPNPFNPSTIISYEIQSDVKSQTSDVIGQTSDVHLIVYDILGNEIMTLVKGRQLPGSYEVEFNGADLSSGIYFYKMEVNGNVIDTKRMILLQ